MNAVPENSGDQRGGERAEADDHLKTPEAAGPVIFRGEFRNERPLNGIERAAVKPIQDKNGENGAPARDISG